MEGFLGKVSKPIDNDIRELAVSELDRNLVVTAGAGTGKTTLLVNRILHLLLGHRRFHAEESPVRRIVAMTFTEKAASDIKVRLMGELEKIVAVINGSISGEEKRKTEEFLSYIRDRYQTTYSEVERRAKKSLEDMDKALIGTIHGFAAYILRLYPIESGVAPGFAVDEGDVFDELFDKEWSKWLETELRLDSPNANTWKTVLKRLDLASLKGFAKRLSGFTIPLDTLSVCVHNKASLQSFVEPFIKKIHDIAAFCEKPNNNLLQQLNELRGILDAIKNQGIGYLNTLVYDFDKEPSKAKTGWTDEGFEVARELARGCHALLRKLKEVDEEFIKTTLDIIRPFAKIFRQRYLSQGYVSFDGLLTLTRDLLHKSAYRSIRNKLKSEFRTILVDEFQDTDPTQYDIVLFLSESPAHYSTDARRVILEPGKLFIVGDPKQSIYAFRRADIEAYEQVVQQVCGQDETLKLRENFRSHSGIIDVVNYLFDGRIMVEKQGLQPAYIPIHANRKKTHSSQKVEMILVSQKDEKEIKAEDARAAEAEWIAQWISRHVNNELIEDRTGKSALRKLRYKDVALLLRAFTQVKPYIEALKGYGIPYIIEGEKYFYTTQEITDFINLLRALENPHDTIALVGVLRSPLVGLTDREIFELKENNLLDYRSAIPDKTHSRDIVETFYQFLKRMRIRAGILPISQLITEIMDSYPIAEITAISWHGEQKLANLWKLYQMACDMEETDGVSLKTFIDRISTRIKEAREEGESPLSDETLDVVKILSIHKSKGLEFPVVILGNLHGKVRNDNETLDPAVFDWSTSTTGIVIGKGDGQIRNLHSISIERKLNDRSWEEEKRVLYVAMTRAMERLILTGSLKDDNKSYMGMIIQSLRSASDIEPDKEHTCEVSLGDEKFFIEHFTFDGTRHSFKKQGVRTLNTDWLSLVEIWRKRKDAMIDATAKPLFTSPTALAGQETQEASPDVADEESGFSTHFATMVGSLCHRVLEVWDFRGTKDALQNSLNLALSEIFPFDMAQVWDGERIKAEAFAILSDFFNSEVYKGLRGVQILGREIPILLRWNGQIMRGAIDLLYKIDDRIVIADYKTDHVNIDELQQKSLPYGFQKEIYCEAVKRCLKVDNPEFKLIFLRIGQAVAI
ncbi:MAG TPA: UvrD-helicase domain-containing protein [Candidatus Brocadiaceae bacterium]